MKLSELSKKESSLAQGYRTCSGCPITTIVRHVLRATDDPVVVAVATGCLEVTTSIYPETSWNVPFVHSAIENVAATISGMESAYKILERRGKITKPVKFVVFGGDGATYDIGLQYLSAAIERGHDFTYVCYDNQAYMNTGGQKSGATPIGSATTTTPVGKTTPEGHLYRRKDVTRIIAAHEISYVAQAALFHWTDFYNKSKKALETKGPSFLNVFSPCIPGWKIETDMAIELSKLAVTSRYWPLYEVQNGEYKITVPVEKPTPLEDFLKPQGRFKHLLADEGKKGLKELKEAVTKRYRDLEKIST